jgi:hypothetical protein
MRCRGREPSRPRSTNLVIDGGSVRRSRDKGGFLFWRGAYEIGDPGCRTHSSEAQPPSAFHGAFVPSVIAEQPWPWRIPTDAHPSVKIQVPPRSKIGRLTSGWGPRPVIRRSLLNVRVNPRKRTSMRDRAMSHKCRYCSLIPGFDVKLSAIILAGPTVLSAVGGLPSA